METTVKQIHTEVDNAVETLLLDAPYDRFQANYLSALGFEASENVRDAADHQEHHKDARYYQQKYPQYKFITEHQFEKIRAKYALESGPFSRFKGAIPEKNVKEMMEFSIATEHIRENVSEPIININSGVYERYVEIITGRSYGKVMNDYYPPGLTTGANDDRRYHSRPYGPENFAEQFKRQAEKAARAKPVQARCNLTDVVRNFPQAVMITADKSLFLAPAWFRCPIVTVAVTGGYLVVTAWGAEAQDPDVLNEKMN